MPHAHTEFNTADLLAGRPVFWGRGLTPLTPVDDPSAELITPSAVAEVAQRFARFAPLMALLFDSVAAHSGVIESPLLPVPQLQRALGLSSDHGALYVKADHQLPIAGSVKARGGTHEVIEFAERLALQHRLITPEGDYRALASPQARALFGQYTVAVGSTGNLGLAIGTMAAALGFRAEVHMSADAKDWKKRRLRGLGVHVVEHPGDYASAVAAGRRNAADHPKCHFVDDEHSTSLFLGYANAASHLAQQLHASGRVVDAEHPLFVYLPCGVGGAPGGIAYGLHLTYGRHVHCIFAEPTASPCFLMQLLADSDALPTASHNPSVYDIGLDNRTEADGLAVPQASLLAAAVAGPQVAGVYTVADDTLFQHLYVAQTTEGLRIEPSAAAGFSGPRMLLGTNQGRHYLASQGIGPEALQQATHIAWLTGGMLVPDAEYQAFVERGKSLEKRGV